MQQTVPPTADRVAHAEPTSSSVTGSGPGHPAFEAWFAGSRITHNGAPLVCYHGTAADFSVFTAHHPVTVYRLNGEAIARLDSWDVDGDWSRRPEGFHYGALVDAQTMGAEAALRFRTREAASLAPRAPDPSDDTERRLTDLRRLVGGTFTQTIETRATGDGHYFTPDQSYSFVRDIGRHDAGRVLPVYLSIRNPIYLNASQIETAGMADRVAHYRALGHDGAIFADYPDDLTRRGWNGATQIVAFDAHQIKSVWNIGTFDPANPDIRFRRDEAATLATPRAPTPFTFPGHSPFGAGVRARLPASSVGEAPAAPAPTLTEETARAHRAAAFQAWFADSAIRQADGRPRVLYHGTATDFTAFRQSRGSASDPGWYGSGIYLTADAELASAYAGEITDAAEAPDKAHPANGPRVIAAYAALQNPYHWPQDRRTATTVEEAEAIRAELEAAGYDGVVVGNAYADPEVAAHWEVIAFHPTQVKSVNNVGTFNPAVADMRYARSRDALALDKTPADAPGAGLHVAGTLRTETEAFRQWFGASRVVRGGVPQVVYHGSRADIGAFDLARAGEHSDRTGDVAFFTSSPRVASGYAVHLDQNAELVALTDETRILRARWAQVRAQHGADTAAYRAAEAAYWTVADRRAKLAAAIHNFAAPSTGANVLAAYLALENPLEIDAGGALSRKNGLMARAIAQAQAEGRDGVIVRNVLDHATTATREVSDVFVVFDATRIKAAYGNSGEYSAASPDLRFARGADQMLPAPAASEADGQGVDSARRQSRKEGALRDADAAFDAWFANSQITDETGAPLVVYHGTVADVAKFDLSRAGQNFGDASGLFFTSDPRNAAAYAVGDGANLLPVYLSIQRPLRVQFAGFNSDRHFFAQRGAITGRAHDAGHDGIIATDTAGNVTFVAFEPEQVKSAIGNVGSYDRESPDIRFSRSASATLAIEDKNAGASRDADAAFDAWFRDSKILDVAGEPLVLYHGTKSDFTAYDARSIGATDDGLLGRGFYFTYNADEASSYALNTQYGNGDAPNVQPVYVALNNPFVIAQGLLPDGRTVQDLHGGTVITASGGNAVRQLAESAGHDGIVWTNREGKILHVVAWRPEQIKSAIGNAGTYDAGNPDIRFSRTSAATPVLAAIGNSASNGADLVSTDPWMAGSKAVDESGKPLILYHGTATTFDQFKVPHQGAYFTSEKEVAQAYAEYAVCKAEGTTPHVKQVHLAIRNPLVVNLHGATYSYRRFERAIVKAKCDGHDGIQFRNVDDMPWGTSTTRSDVWVAFDSQQIRTVTPTLTLEADQCCGQRSPGEAFDAWFGDSMAIDAQGEPLVLYHGTQADFSAFEPDHRRSKSRTGVPDPGFFFTPDPAIASLYAGCDEHFPSPEIGSVMPVHLRVTNPLIFDFEGNKYGRREVIERAIANGHDGVLMRNHYDAGGVSDQWVVFSPNQIKSIFNTGAYDLSNPDIRFRRSAQAAPASTPRATPAIDEGVEP